MNSYKQLWVLLALMIGIGLVGNLIAEGILQLFGYSLMDMVHATNLSLSERMWLRGALIINHMTMFLIAAIVFGRIFHRKQFLQYIKTFNEPNWTIIGLWGVAILCSYPVVGLLTELNMSVPLPEWARSGQDDAFALLNNVLKMEHPLEFLISLFLVGLLPALGEEFIFRGIVQNKLIESFKNPHVAILIASILFGLTHMQLERILPLAFLGLILGYSYYYTQSIMVPVVLHLLNNALQVVLLYSRGEIDPSMIESVPDLSAVAIITSALFTFGLVYVAKNYSVDTAAN